MATAGSWSNAASRVAVRDVSPGSASQLPEGDAEDGDRGLGGQAGAVLGHPSALQTGREGAGPRVQLGQLTFLQLDVRRDHGLAPAGVFPVAADHVGDRRERARRGVHRRRRLRRGGEGLGQVAGHGLGAGEQHLPLVAEVAEERACGEPGTLGDLGDGGLLVPALDVELHRRLPEPAPGVRLPSGP